MPFLEEGALDDIPPPEDIDRPCSESRNDPVNTAPPDSLLWDAHGNVVEGNVLSDNRTADLAVASLGDVSALENCFADNTFTTSSPSDLEELAPCVDGKPGEGSGGDWTANPLDVASWLTEVATRPSAVPYEQAELPALEPQENMPDAATAPAAPATDMPRAVDVDAIGVPDAPTGTETSAADDGQWVEPGRRHRRRHGAGHDPRVTR